MLLFGAIKYNNKNATNGLSRQIQPWFHLIMSDVYTPLNAYCLMPNFRIQSSIPKVLFDLFKLYFAFFFYLNSINFEKQYNEKRTKLKTLSIESKRTFTWTLKKANLCTNYEIELTRPKCK